jgi:hypothetical protein
MNTQSDEIIGYIDVIDISDNSVRIEGWSIDRNSQCPSNHVEIRMNGVCLAEIPIYFSRKDVSRALGDKNLINCGFKYILSKDMNIDYSHLEFYGFSNGKFNRLTSL